MSDVAKLVCIVGPNDDGEPGCILGDADGREIELDATEIPVAIEMLARAIGLLSHDPRTPRRQFVVSEMKPLGGPA